MKTQYRTQIVSLAFLLVLSNGIGSRASHQWNSYARADSSVGRYYWSATGYSSIYDQEGRTDSDSWQNASVMDLPTSTSHYFGICSFDEIAGFAGFYGNTGWDGITSLDCMTGNIIGASQSGINRTYADSYSTDNKKKVACHELGHQFGLSHDDSASDTCMTTSATNGVSHPGDHDIEMLDAIY